MLPVPKVGSQAKGGEGDDLTLGDLAIVTVDEEPAVWRQALTVLVVVADVEALGEVSTHPEHEQKCQSRPQQKTRPGDSVSCPRCECCFVRKHRIIDIRSLRHDSIPGGGSQRATSPFLRSLATTAYPRGDAISR